MTVKKRGLAKGRGLDALLGSIQKEKLQMEAQGIDHGQLKQIDVNLLKRGEYVLIEVNDAVRLSAEL
jgi:ParB family transcriptional regulator, chromosome partitioning protein